MTKEIALTQGKVALVDDSDYEWLMQWEWHAVKPRNTWYAQTYLGGGRANAKYTLLHRAILSAPVGISVDHRDGDGLNNTRANLRLATDTQNACNRGKAPNNTSGFKGVSWNKEKRKWEAYIAFEKKTTKLGYFADLVKAARAYDVAARELHGEFATLNFPDAKTD